MIMHVIKPCTISHGFRSRLKLPLLLSRFSQQDIHRTNKAEIRMAENVFRQKVIYKAVVQDIYDASASIKFLRLLIPENGFSFKAGQWVDFYIPGIKDITGYSLTSAPHQAKKDRTFELAVKYGKFPPTHWIHTKCRKGTEIEIQVGGNFCYDPQPDSIDALSDLILIGGGVGVNPLVSILSEYCHLKSNPSQLNIPGKVSLLYSTKTKHEMIFKEKFAEMEKFHPSIKCQYFITKPDASSRDSIIKYHRIRLEDIEESLQNLQKERTLCYICGPSHMTDDIVDILTKLDVKQSCIRYEKWW